MQPGGGRQYSPYRLAGHPVQEDDPAVAPPSHHTPAAPYHPQAYEYAQPAYASPQAGYYSDPSWSALAPSPAQPGPGFGVNARPPQFQEPVAYDGRLYGDLGISGGWAGYDAGIGGGGGDWRNHPATSYAHSNSPLLSVSLASLTQRAASVRQSQAQGGKGGHGGAATGVGNKMKKTGPTARRSRKIDTYDCRCSGCGKALATIERKLPANELPLPPNPAYLCLTCSPPTIPSKPERSPTDPDVATYEDTLSAQVDRLQGLVLESPATTAPPTPSTSSSTPSLKSKPTALVSSRKKRSAQEQETLTCGVCSLDLATAITPVDLVAPLPPSSIEIVCTSCSERFARCSDCGGGGGVKVGIGKWRAKEMFADGRATCIVSHLRLGTVEDMAFHVWPVADFRPDEAEELRALCRGLFFSTCLAALAVPEILAAPVPLARTFQEVEKLATDSWCLFESYFRGNVKELPNIRRYIALRWSVPSPRKKKKANTSPVTATFPLTDPNNIPVVRKDKQLAGFIIAEYDMAKGTLFIPIILPTGTGETFDCTTLLFEALHKKIDDDVRVVNATLPPKDKVPRFGVAWTMLLDLKEVRVLRRRGFLFLEDYLEKNPDVGEENFPPARPVFLPPELLKGWSVLAYFIFYGTPDGPPPPPPAPAVPEAPPSPPKAFYSGCSSSDFLVAVRDGRALKGDVPFSHLVPPSSDYELPPTTFSFKLAGNTCPPPHAFTPEEACELLSGFGGIYAIGDSFIRHIWSALLMILRGRTDGATHDFGSTTEDHQRCAGERVFIDQPAYCRTRVYMDLQAEEPICGGALTGGCFNTARPDDLAFSQVAPFLYSRPYQDKIPILLQGYGIHYNYDTKGNREWHARINNFTTKHPHPRLLNLWAGVHGANGQQPEWAKKTQGPKRAKAYNKALAKQLARLETPARMIDYFNVTQGANHYDGVHLTMLANMEKAHILLNYLSLVQQEIYEAGEDWQPTA